MKTEVILRENDMVVRLSGLFDEAAGGTYVNDAVVTCQLQDGAGDDVGSIVTMPYVAASDGDYEGLSPYTLGFTEFAKYNGKVVVTSPFYATFNVPIKAYNRDAD